ncbi:M23 family metallopeptidase [Sulfitobacter sp. S190]|uniref:M23 family metallopeptidase n=1 Tax=Sulfitobacter sp. S190 TaxID=2867022 RepID=UPI0021A322AC|nr:M23 family metallopeptidase [Sulfitobacter sp. S190]UWR23118.1 M23 family metallopeptidase [Sulfitobacter sp. S190]
MRSAAYAVFMSLAAPVAAGDFSLVAPLDCDLTDDCYIQQYVDHDTGAGASDFTCASLSYDGHKGTDFALPSRARIAQGVDVLASAAGVVGGTRDGMPDTGYTVETAASIEGRECGNGLVLQHGDGWETQYCHLRRGSLTVERGQRVEAGDVLGQVGMSGRAEFPHVHLSVRRNGEVIDPFDPDGAITCGVPDANTLWSDPVAYEPGGIINVRLAAEVPDYDAVKADAVAQPDATSGAMVVYGFLFGTREGDIIRLSLSGPDGEIVAQDHKATRTQAQSFRAIGKKRRGDAWPDGTYTGTATLLRDGQALDQERIELSISR